MLMPGLGGNVLITGGAGFLGRGIMRRAQRDNWPCRFIIASRDEMKHITARLKYPDARYIVCDVLDSARLSLIMQGVDVVIHAAAAKHIPVCERQPSEALRVNIDGTRCVIDAAYSAGVKRVILISTDKACEPVNTYGATKMLVERLVFESEEFPHPLTTLVGCRYGNIIGSTGSVWPVFKAQRERDGQLSVTDPIMTRYFWGIDDAVDLIVASLSAPNGSVVLPTLHAMVMHELADYLSQLWDLPAYKIVGRRPGEKTHEMLLSPSEVQRTIRFTETLWTLLRPTVSVAAGSRPTVNFTSEFAADLPVDEFMRLAEDSESV